MAADPAPAAHVSRKRARRRRSPFSGLTRQIVAANILALIILVGGILYINQLRTGLVDTRVSALVNQAEIVAAALGEAAGSGPAATEVDVDLARPVLARLIHPEEGRGRLFSTSGELVADTRKILPEGGLEEEDLPPPDSWSGPTTWWQDLEAWFLRLIAGTPDYPMYEEYFDQAAQDYPEALAALEGRVESAVRQTEQGDIVITVAAPVQRFRRVLGALMISVETSEIEELVRQERMAIFEVFVVAALMTLMLSVVLASTIARPVRKLADFAHEVRQGGGRDVAIPDFSRRNDEVGDLSNALNDMTQALYRRIDAIEAFAADVAHEIKNPLTSLRSAVETLERTDKPEHKDKLMAIIQDDVQRLDRLISDISNASRLDAELLRGEMQPVRAYDIIHSIAEVYQATGKDKVPIRLDVEVGEARFAGIESAVGQVIRNLIDNAMSFSPEHGIITVRARTTRAELRIEVEDDGPGIPEDKLQKIFERFYSERPESHHIDGHSGDHSGLGLNISKQIITVHNGALWAENRGTPSGARFIITLPRVRGRAEA